MLRAYARTGVDPVFAEDDEAVERADADIRARELASALAALRRDEREIFLLHAWAELTDSEIADARTGRSVMNDLLTAFRSDVPLPDAATAERVYARATRSRRRAATRGWLVVAVAAVALAAAGFGISALAQSSGKSQSVGPGALEPGITTLGVNPFGAGGELVTLQQFLTEKASHGYDVPVPDSPLANSRNIGSIWVNPATGGEEAIYYPSSGIELVYCGSCGVDYTGFPPDQIQRLCGGDVASAQRTHNASQQRASE